MAYSDPSQSPVDHLALADAPALSGSVGGKTFLGHPLGLFVLFFAEMWERFSYYGMRALLVLYLTKHFLFSEEKAYIIYGAYTSLVYITPAIGGWLADQFLGQRKAVLFGAVLLTFGHILMAFEGEGGQSKVYLNFFYLALSFIIVGSGFLKANISSIVGALYDRDDKRKDPAFTIFYMGINLGAALGAIVAGYLGEKYGWKYGFGAAGIGMILGLIVFVLGKPLLMGRGESPFPQRLKQVRVGLPTEWLIYIGAVISVLGVWQLIQYQAIVGWLLGASGLALASYVMVTSIVTLKSEDRDRIFVAMFLMGASILFWALFEQAGSSLNVFTDRRVDRNMFGFEVPASTFQSINAIYIVLLAPVFAGLWTFLGARKLEPSTPAKFGLAMLQLGAGFLVLVAGAAAAGNGLTPVLFIFAIYLLHTTGELCLSPVGLSAMTKLALPHMVGLIMGTWFFASALGNFTAGLIAQATGGEAVKKDAVTVEVVTDTAAETFVFKALLKEPVEGGFTVDYKIVAVKPKSEPVATPDAAEAAKAAKAVEQGAAAKAGDKAEEAKKNTLPAGTIAFEGTEGEVEEVTVTIPADAILAEGEKLGVELGKPNRSTERVLRVYSMVGWSALIVGLLIVIISPFFKRLMHLESLHQTT